MNEFDKVMQGWKNDTEVPEVVREKAEEAFARLHRECADLSESGRLSGTRTGQKMFGKCRKGAAVALIAAAALGSVVLAATRLHLAELFPSEFASPQAKEQIVTGIDVEVTGQTHMPEAYREEGTEDLFWGREVIPDPSPVLQIEEVQYDGASLYIYGSSTDNGKQYELNTDRIYINDEEYGPVSTVNLNQYTGEDGYTFITNLRALHLEDDFTITLPLSIYQGEKRFQNQELTFTLSAKADVQKAEDQTFVHDGYTIAVTDIVRTTNVVSFSVHYQLSEEKREELRGIHSSLTSVISCDGVEEGQNGFLSGHEVADGYVEEHVHAGLPSELDQIILQTRLVEEGGYVRDGEVISEDTIQLGKLVSEAY